MLGIMPRSSLPTYRLYHRPVKIGGVEVLGEDVGGPFYIQWYAQEVLCASAVRSIGEPLETFTACIPFLPWVTS